MKKSVLLASLVSAVLFQMGVAQACPEKPKEITLPGSSFGSFEIGANCGAKVKVADVWMSLARLEEIKSGPLKDQGGQTVGILKKESPQKVVIYSVGANGKALPQQPRLEVVFKSDKLVLIKAVKNGAVVGTTTVTSTGCRRSYEGPGTASFTIEGKNLKTVGGGCGTGLESSEFTGN